MNKDFSVKMKRPLEEGLVPTNDLERYFLANTQRVIHKWWHYFPIYERHLSRFRGQSPTLLEIGVFKGGSLQMWQEYFGPGCRIIGLDIDPSCKQYAEPGIEILIGSQEDRQFLRHVREYLGQVDILIDDGGHSMAQQLTTFEELYGMVTAERNGVYLCEDTHTSYYPHVTDAGLGNPNSFMEMTKSLVDQLHTWHCDSLSETEFSRTTQSLHFYDSVVVMEKSLMTPPWHGMTGDI